MHLGQPTDYQFVKLPLTVFQRENMQQNTKKRPTAGSNAENMVLEVS